MGELTDKLSFKRGLTLKNRIIMPPMTTKMSFYDGTITNDEIAYYAMRSGEVGAVITGAANVQADGKGWDGELSVADDTFIPGLAKLAAAIKKNGTKAILQIFHAGRMTNSGILHGTQIVAPSAIAAEREQAQTPRSLSDDEIRTIITNFKLATKRAIEAGFDGVEIHGANTYLVQQFFSPHSNRRDDVWGGNLAKRYKFINDLVDGVTEVVDQADVQNFIVGYRFSPEEYENPGIRFADTLFLVEHLADKPLDYLHLSLDDYQKISVSAEYQEKSMLAYIHEKIGNRLPLIGVGNVRTGADAQGVLQNAELVGVGRDLLIDPHWAGKVLTGQEKLLRTTLSPFDRDELLISNGVWVFLKGMMPERIEK